MGQIKNIKLHIVTDIKASIISVHTFDFVPYNHNNNNSRWRMMM